MNKSFLFRFLILFVTVFGMLFLIVWFYLSITKPADAAEPPAPAVSVAQSTAPVTFEWSDVQIRTEGGHAYRVYVEMALSEAQQRQGLMFRENLAENTGMLFVYKPPQRVAMWMKNTLIPLDMLFAGRTGSIFHIVENATPMSEEMLPSPAKATYVLELPAGTVERLGVKVGDTLVK